MGARGEATIRAGGEELPILFTNRALGDVEQATGKGVLQIVSEAREMRLSMTDTAQLLRAGLEHGRRDARVARKPYSLDDACAVMDELGWLLALEQIVGPLGEVLRYRGEGADDDAVPPA